MEDADHFLGRFPTGKIDPSPQTFFFTQRHQHVFILTVPDQRGVPVQVSDLRKGIDDLRDIFLGNKPSGKIDLRYIMLHDLPLGITSIGTL